MSVDLVPSPTDEQAMLVDESGALNGVRTTPRDRPASGRRRPRTTTRRTAATAADLGWFGMLADEAHGGGSMVGQRPARRVVARGPSAVPASNRDRSSEHRVVVDMLDVGGEPRRRSHRAGSTARRGRPGPAGPRLRARSGATATDRASRGRSLFVADIDVCTWLARQCTVAATVSCRARPHRLPGSDDCVRL